MLHYQDAKRELSECALSTNNYQRTTIQTNNDNPKFHYFCPSFAKTMRGLWRLPATELFILIKIYLHKNYGK